MEKAFDEAKREFSGSNVKKEGKVDTPGGSKSTRFGDVTVYDGTTPVKVYQVGDVLSDGITPVSRERQAIGDFLRRGIDVAFIPKP